jgi:hypothetical protein
VQAVIRHRLPPDRRQATAQRAVALLAAAGDPNDPASWPDYARLPPRVLATAPVADHSSAGRQLVLDTSRCLQAHGDSHSGRAVGAQLLDRWQALRRLRHPCCPQRLYLHLGMGNKLVRG